MGFTLSTYSQEMIHAFTGCDAKAGMVQREIVAVCRKQEDAQIFQPDSSAFHCTLLACVFQKKKKHNKGDVVMDCPARLQSNF